MIAFGMAFIVRAMDYKGSKAVRIPQRLLELVPSEDVAVIPCEDDKGAYLEIRPLR